jgi:hypothetical protein
LKINGQLAWGGVDEFFFDQAGLLYRKLDASRDYVFDRRLADGTWQVLHRNVKQFSIRPDGEVYTLSHDGELKINGQLAWGGVDEFFFDQAGLLYRKLDASRDYVFDRRLADGTWQVLHRNVKQFSIRPDGEVYALSHDGELKINGQLAWGGVDEFFFDQAGLLYRKLDASRDYVFDRRLADGTWQVLHRNVKQFVIRPDGTVYSLGKDGILNVNGQSFWHNVSMVLNVGNRLYIMRDDRAVWEYNATTLRQITGNDVNMMLVAGGKLYVLPDNRAVWEYDGHEFHQITGNDVNIMLVAGGKLYVLPDNRAVWEYDGKEFHQITGNDVNMMLVAGGKLYVLPDNRAVWEYDGKEFHQITGNDVNMMLVAGGKLYVLPDNRAVWEYDEKEFRPITGYDVKTMLVAGGKLYVLPDNRAVWEYDGKDFHRITGYDIKIMVPLGGALHVLADNRAIWKYAASGWTRISGFDIENGGIDSNGRFVLWTGKKTGNLYTLDSKGTWTLIDTKIEEFGYNKAGQLVWERDGGLFDDIGDFLRDYAPTIVSWVTPGGFLGGAIAGEATRAMIQHDQFYWRNVGEMYVNNTAIGATAVATVLTAGALGPAAGAAIGSYIVAGAAAGAAGALANQTILAVGDLSGLKDGYTFDALAIVKAALIGAATGGIGGKNVDPTLVAAARGAAGAAANEGLNAMFDLLGIKDGYVFDPLSLHQAALLSAAASVGTRLAQSPPTPAAANGESRISTLDSRLSYRSLGKELYVDIDYSLSHKIGALANSVGETHLAMLAGLVSLGPNGQLLLPQKSEFIVALNRALEIARDLADKNFEDAARKSIAPILELGDEISQVAFPKLISDFSDKATEWLEINNINPFAPGNEDIREAYERLKDIGRSLLEGDLEDAAIRSIDPIIEFGDLIHKEYLQGFTKPWEDLGAQWLEWYYSPNLQSTPPAFPPVGVPNGNSPLR